jgi:hypothetical protein
MARRPAPPPKPKSPILTVGQKRRRIERLQKCITNLEAFDPEKARKRAPAVLELEASIDKALSSAFGYGTPAYLRYNDAPHWTRAHFSQALRSEARRKPLLGRHGTTRRFRKRVSVFQRIRREQSPFFSKRFAASKKRSPRPNRSYLQRQQSKHLPF